MRLTQPAGMRFATFGEFWPFYLHLHRMKETRLLHFAGLLLAVFWIVGSVILAQFALLWAAPVIGYGFAWWAHMFIERNRPATFKYPVWSLRADFYMFGLWLTGRLNRELTRYKIVDI
jgi:hypothetical protein